MSANLLKSVQCGRSIIASGVIRHKHTLITGEGRLSVEAVGAQRQQPHQQMHQVVVSAQQSSLTPPASVLMPPNVQELQASEKAQFSPRRTRDTSSARIAAYSLYGSGSFGSEGVRESRYNQGSIPVDRHVDVYDCSDTVALDSLVQTNVPKPYGLSGQAPSQFSSPDCHGAQDDKYVAGDLQEYHQSTQNSSKKTSVE